MPRLESEEPKRFEIIEEKKPVGSQLVAVPLTLRKQAVEQFDLEFRLSEKNEREQRFDIQRQANPEMAEALLNAKSLLQKGEPQLAMNLYRNVMQMNPQSELAIRGAAECAKALFQHEEALNILLKLVEAHKTSENYKMLGDQLYAMSYLEDAVEAYMRALQSQDLEPGHLFIVYKNIGNIFLRLADPDGAEEFYNKAYTIDPESDSLFVNYGSLYVYKGDYNKALDRFREAIKLNDKNDKAWVGLAMIHREFGDLELAWANVEKALDILPANESAIKLVADWAMKDNEIDKAAFRLSTYVKLNTEDSIVAMWLAKFLYFQGHLKEARHEIERALVLNPEIDGGEDVLSVIRSEIADREAKHA